MKKKQLKTYCIPVSTLVHVKTSSLMETSFPSQHNPGQHGTGPSSAKQGMNWEELQEGEERVSTWED